MRDDDSPRPRPTTRHGQSGEKAASSSTPGGEKADPEAAQRGLASPPQSVLGSPTASDGDSGAEASPEAHAQDVLDLAASALVLACGKDLVDALGCHQRSG